MLRDPRVTEPFVTNDLRTYVEVVATVSEDDYDDDGEVTGTASTETETIASFVATEIGTNIARQLAELTVQSLNGFIKAGVL
jgi:hypothetical protein